MSNQAFAADYVQVNERIVAFYEKFPEGSLQSELLELSETRVVVRGFAYRTPDDPRPGIGMSSLTIPGKTPYTRDSEIENAETSAWGRALAALGFEVKRSVASANEIAAKGGQSRPVARQEPIERHEPAAAAQPAADSHGWNEGDVHADGHRPLRARASGHLFCPTKLPDGRWCSFDAGSAPRETAAKAATPPPAEEVGPAQDDLCGAASVYQDGTTCNLLRGHAGPSHRVLDDAGKAVSSWPVAA